jgi:hypothetical protein
VEKNQATKTKEKWCSRYIYKYILIRWGASTFKKGRRLPNHNYLIHLILSYISLDGPTCFGRFKEIKLKLISNLSLTVALNKENTHIIKEKYTLSKLKSLYIYVDR